MQKNITSETIDFLFEINMLSKMQRSGLAQLGSGKQSIQEHSYRVSLISYILGTYLEHPNPEKLAFMGLIHDLEETRVHDIIPSHKKYIKQNKELAMEEMTKNVIGGNKILSYVNEVNDKLTLDAEIVNEADMLEWSLTLYEMTLTGNIRAKEWLEIAEPRITKEYSKELYKKIISNSPDSWWYKICDIQK